MPNLFYTCTDGKISILSLIIGCAIGSFLWGFFKAAYHDLKQEAPLTDP